ncbi:glycosyl hydrolase [Streptomyces sp. DSM 44915]|uniref:glucan endo-1,3-beta-D-glucosidase n=1 Tax=Streptomyces chisholmiae TaxID=3075540 RepID=A0ABU2K165_9ACTN|nr:glycosyl hydrolase [Streptomyces sp. DSM 44915]MDT0270817.1 glycosyl hydrolase [Streptomyces sp. DSM 44915]
MRPPTHPRRLVLALTATAVAVAGASLVPGSANAAEIPVGSGSYSDTRPPGAVGPSDSAGNPVLPQVTEAVADQPVPTNDWWSSLVFKRYADIPHSQPMYGHPLSYRAVAEGLEVGYQTEPTVAGVAYHYHHAADLTLGLAGLDSPDTKADGWSDWTVTPYWADGDRTFRATIGHGSPFVYAEGTGAGAEIAAGNTPEVFADEGATLGVTVNGRDYALFAPSGSDWTVSGDTISSDLGGQDYYSVAVLPDRSALDLYAQYAYSFVTGSTVDWTYDETAGQVSATYTLETEAREGTETGTVQALYPHQWQHTTDELTEHGYVSPRGEMRVRDGAAFTTTQDVTGVLPTLPASDGPDQARLATFVNEVAADAEIGFGDTYWSGKEFGRLAQVVGIADQIGETAARDALLDALRAGFEEWFTAGGAAEFAYDAEWRTLTGYPASYGSDQELNDHHFHYSYFVYAAAVVAQYDPAWAADSAWGGMVNELIGDAANPARDDERYPFLRGFDVYAGHSWAAGHQGFEAGNNQESSSESVNLSAGLVLWGSATGDTELRDLGVYLLTTESEAIRQYWFDGDEQNFPADYQHNTVGMVWGNGAAHSTWWTDNPEEIHGINVLPVTGGSLHLARDKDAILRNLAELVAENGGPPVEWKEILWEFQALADPAAARAAYESDGGGTYEPEAGESWAHVYHWLYTLDAVGAPDPTVTADSPTAAAFSDGTTTTYTAHNHGDSERTVTFSDGTTLTVPPQSSASHTG